MHSGLAFSLVLVVMVVVWGADRVALPLSLRYARWRCRKLRTWKERLRPHELPLLDQQRAWDEWRNRTRK